jgi:hypothetical protein
MNYQRWPIELSNDYCFNDELLREVGVHEVIKNTSELYCSWINDDSTICGKFIGFGKEAHCDFCHLHKYEDSIRHIDMTLTEYF